MCLQFPYSILAPRPPSLAVFFKPSPLHLHTFGCKHAHRSVEDVHPFTCVALICIFPTPRVVQNYKKKTPLMIAMEKKNDAMVTALLDHNADPDIQDDVRQGAHEDERGSESMDM